MKTKEGNKLIAEFMGFKFKGDIAQNEPFYTLDESHPLHHIYLQGYSIHFAKFDSSWDWLMPVMEKCFSILDTLEHKDFKQRPRVDYVEWATKLTITPRTKFKPDIIGKAYKRAIEFIEWYNKPK
jgi:hypothetical protein